MTEKIREIKTHDDMLGDDFTVTTNFEVTLEMAQEDEETRDACAEKGRHQSKCRI